MKKGARRPKSKRSMIAKKTKRLIKTGRKKLEDLHLQPIWNRVKKELQVAARVIEKGTEKATQKTLSMGKQARLEYQIYLKHHKLQRTLGEVGGRIYDLTKRNSKAITLKDRSLLKMINQLKKMDKEIISLKRREKALKKI